MTEGAVISYEKVDCPDCEGRGFFEENHGLVMIRCDRCKGKKSLRRKVKDANSD